MPNYEAIEKAVANNSRYNDINILQEDGSAVSLLKKYGLLLNKGYPKIGKAEPLKMLVQVPGGQTLDLTRSLDGKIHFISRKIEIQVCCFRPKTQWDALRHDLEQLLHGQWVWFRFKDSVWYWRGQANVSMEHTDRAAVITITAVCNPYSYNLTAYLGNDWLWDSFNFDEDTIYTTSTEVKRL